MKKIIKNWLFLINIFASQTVVLANDDINQFESYDQIISKHSFVNGKGVCRAFGIKLYEAELLSEYPIKKKIHLVKIFYWNCNISKVLKDNV